MEINRSDFVDKITNWKTTIKGEHHEIHEGNHFYYADYTTLGSSAVAEFIVTPPTTSNKWIHLIFSVRSTKGFTLEMYKNPTTIVGGTTITPVNSNENFSDDAETVIKKDPTSIGDDGTRRAGYAGGANIDGGIVIRSNELILDVTVPYLFRITSQDATNLIAWIAEFYEKINKNQDN